MKRRTFLGHAGALASMPLVMPYLSYAFPAAAPLRVNGARLNEWLTNFDRIGRTPTGINRVAYSEADLAGRAFTQQLLRDADRDISLDQARLLLQRLTPSQLRNVAEGTERIAAVIDTDRPTVLSKGDALAYISRLKLGTTHPSPHSGGARPSLRSHAMPAGPDTADTTLPVLEQAAKALGGLVGLSAKARSVRAEHWYRLPLTPDIELSVRGEFGPEQLAQLHRIGDALRILLTKGAVK